MKEIDHLMTLESNGLKEYGGELQSKAAQLREWLDTPVGSVYGLPGWGCILNQFKHEPTNQAHVQVTIECQLLQKLAEDLPNLKITGIGYIERDFDWAQLTIKLPEGTINEQVSK
ncbi:hypothetical protein CYR55_22370 [Chimaeribacter californicus]|uniref:Uncharacterized protein n=1 Tax=Chimaeribacter californicus TaxID=2060067 RepID=A0A2N5DU29_9GAMM|nr:hypothetical protein [Chimaeribacter californicus]PLR30231.1 hypothetical protein CYR55_22370 [Chimaeribacter californicus]